MADTDDGGDGDDPQASLIGLIVQAAARRGPADRRLSALAAGGETAADALSAVLEHALTSKSRNCSSKTKEHRPLIQLPASVAICHLPDKNPVTIGGICS